MFAKILNALDKFLLEIQWKIHQLNCHLPTDPILAALLMLENEACLSGSSSNSSSCSSSNESDLMLVHTNDMLLQHATRIVADIDGGNEDSTIKW
jgi:hypothetical protein